MTSRRPPLKTSATSRRTTALLASDTSSSQVNAAAGQCYRTSPNEVTSRSMVDALRRKDFAYGVVVTPFDEAL
jgi:hypothetical protein